MRAKAARCRKSRVCIIGEISGLDPAVAILMYSKVVGCPAVRIRLERGRRAVVVCMRKQRPTAASARQPPRRRDRERSERSGPVLTAPGSERSRLSLSRSAVGARRDVLAVGSRCVREGYVRAPVSPRSPRSPRPRPRQGSGSPSRTELKPCQGGTESDVAFPSWPGASGTARQVRRRHLLGNDPPDPERRCSDSLRASSIRRRSFSIRSVSR